jgi:hypothetical protein
MLERLMKYRLKPLDKLIGVVEAEMLTRNPDSNEYKTLLASLERLRALKDDNRPERLNRNTILLVIGNLAGIVVIVAYEQYHPFISRAAREVIKPKYQNP